MAAELSATRLGNSLLLFGRRDLESLRFTL